MMKLYEMKQKTSRRELDLRSNILLCGSASQLAWTHRLFLIFSLFRIQSEHARYIPLHFGALETKVKHLQSDFGV